MPPHTYEGMTTTTITAPVKKRRADGVEQVYHTAVDQGFTAPEVTIGDVTADYSYEADSGFKIYPLQSEYIKEGGPLAQESAWEFVCMYPNATADDYEDAVTEYETRQALDEELANSNSPYVVDPYRYSVLELPSGGRAVIDNTVVHRFFANAA